MKTLPRGNRFLSNIWESYPQSMIFYIFLHIFQIKSCVRIILGNLRLKKELNFKRLQKWRKVVRPRIKFFESIPKLTHPQLAHLATGKSCNWHFSQNFFVLMRIWVPQLLVHPLLCVYWYYLILQIYEQYCWLNFFGLILKSSSYTKRNFLYILLFFRKFVGYLPRKKKVD